LAVSNPLMAIFRAVGMGIGVGSASLVSRRLGAGKREEADRVAAGAITLFLMVSALVTLLCLLNLTRLLRLFGAGETVLPLAKSYMIVETSFIALDFLVIVLAELVRVEGNPVLASVAMITSGLMNCIWDPILIWGFGPFPRLGIAGAAVATSVGRGIGASILIVYLMSSRSSYRCKLSYFKPNFKIAADIYRVGASMTLRITAGSVSQILASITASSFGVVPLAVVGVLFRASSFAFTPCMGLGQGVLPLVGYNYGAKKKDRVGEVVIKAGITGFTWGVLCWVVAMLFATQVMSIFSTAPDFLAAAVPALRIYALGYFTVGLQTILSFFFQGIGKALPSLVVTSSRQLIFLIPSILIFPRLFGLTGLWVAYPVADTLSLLLTVVWLSVEFRHQGIPFRLRSNPVAVPETVKD
ncbi:MAG: MATE family efflux transporter, partial [Dehalococcoidales bacterium]|nr:MATE family efflux transporter [Dehalococcoidales bacterium]